MSSPLRGCGIARRKPRGAPSFSLSAAARIASLARMTDAVVGKWKARGCGGRLRFALGAVRDVLRRGLPCVSKRSSGAHVERFVRQ